MEAAQIFLREALWSGLAPTGVFCMWLWSLAGWRHLSHSSYTDLIRGRNVAVSSAMALCLVLTLLSVPLAPLLPPLATALLSALAFLLYLALDPAREGFWHHRRIRWIGAGVTLAIAVFLGLTLSLSVLIPVLFAAGIFHRHHMGGIRLTNQCLTELEELKSKILSLEALSHGSRLAWESRADKLDEAG